MIYLPVSVRMSVHPSAHFRWITLIIFLRIFFKFCIHSIIRDEWYGIVNGRNWSIFSRTTALVHTGKIVSGLLFLYFLLYLNETSQLGLSSKVTYCDKEPSLRLFPFISCSPLIDPNNVF